MKCAKCETLCSVPDRKVPVGRSFLICPHCEARINIFKGLPPGSTIVNLVGVRFAKEGDGLDDEYCEPGQEWRVVEIVAPCPDKGRGRACELENKGRCPNQRMLVRRRKDKTMYRSCLYRKGRKVFDKTSRTPVGAIPVSEVVTTDDDKTYRIH